MSRRQFWNVALVLASCVLVDGAVVMTSPPAGAAEDKTLAALLKTFHSEFVGITPGKGKFPASFVMGSEKGPVSEQPAHKVTIGYSFAIAMYEVPQNLYEGVMGTNPSKWKGKRNSAEMFDYNDAVTFCRKVTNLLRKTTIIGDDEEIRLPTEAEWEYCCRAGTTTAYSFGDSATAEGDEGKKASVLDKYGWHTGNAEGNDPPVGAKEPNPWGLYDMHGYLWEFTSDPWHETYDGAPTDGSARKSEEQHPKRVLRSGSWKDKYDALRSAARRPIDEMKQDDAVGLRCVKAKVSK